MTQDAIVKAKKDLNFIILNYALQAFKKANTKKDGTYYKKRRTYVLPMEAITANELLKILNKDNITIEEEEEIKAFLIPYRTIRTEFLHKNQ